MIDETTSAPAPSVTIADVAEMGILTGVDVACDIGLYRVTEKESESWVMGQKETFWRGHCWKANAGEPEWPACSENNIHKHAQGHATH